MARTLIKNVHIADPRSEFHQKKIDVLIVEGTLKALGPGLKEKSDMVIEAEDLWLSPGWVDMECYLAEPGFEHKETLSDLLSSAARGGFTQVLGYPNTEPAVDNAQILGSLLSKAREFPVTLNLAGALSHGLKGQELAELYDMHLAGARAFCDGYLPLNKAGLLLRAMLYSQPFGGLIIDRPLDQSLAGEGQVFEGLQAVRLGMKGIPDLAESLPVQRDLDLLNYAGGRLHIQPVTSGTALEQLAEAKSKLPGLSAGISVAYLCYSDADLESYETNYKVDPPLRDPATRDSLQKALASGVIDVLTSGHRAQGVEEKKLEYPLAEPGMHSLQTVYPLVQEKLIDPGHLSLEKMVECLSIRPRKILGLEEARLETGQQAELTLFQPRKTWRLTASDLPSRAKNTPLLDRDLKGSVYGIFAKGQFLPQVATAW